MARPLPRGRASFSLLRSCLLWLAFLAFLQTNHVAAQSSGRTYIVRSGDTLVSIAAQLDLSVEELAEANDLTDVDVLDVGQILWLPAESASRGVIFARPGDTVQTIAAREGLSMGRLAILNRTTPTARLFPGQLIQYPRDTLRSASAQNFGSVQIISVPAAVVQGQAGWLQVEASRPLPLRAQWNGAALGIRPLAVRERDAASASEGGSITVWGGYVPTPASLGPGVYPLRLSYEARNGVTVTRTFSVQVQKSDFLRQEIVLPPDKSALLDEALLQSELDHLSQVWSRTSTPIQWTQPFRLPLSSPSPTTSPYGVERNYNGGQYHSFHTGQDFAAPGGSPVVASADGIVALAEPLDVRGQSVILDHGAGLFTGYWHLREALVTPGATVHAGDPIGLVGTTGRSTGEHLHWELRIYGVAVDPMPFLTKPLLAPLSQVESNVQLPQTLQQGSYSSSSSRPRPMTSGSASISTSSSSASSSSSLTAARDRIRLQIASSGSDI